jgi:predicted PurR-regulated permease PerM
VAVLTVLVGVTGFLGLLIATVVPALLEQGRSLLVSAPDLLEKLRASDPISWADQQFGVIGRAKRELAENAGAATGLLFRVVQGVFTGIVGTVTVIVLAVFMLLFGGQLFDKALEWIAPLDRERYVVLARQMRNTVGRYVGGTLIIALLGGAVTAVTLAILGVPYFLPLGFAMALLGIIPFVGSALGGILVVGTTFLSSGTKAGVIALVVFLLYQQVENELLHPIVQRRTIQMNALLVALVMLVGTTMAGVLGAVLSLPIAAATQTVLRDVLERRKERRAT